MKKLLVIIDTTGEPDILTAIIDKAMLKPSLKLNGWQTIATIAKEKKCSTQYISKLIRQGVYEVEVYPELNNLKLIKKK